VAAALAFFGGKGTFHAYIDSAGQAVGLVYIALLIYSVDDVVVLPLLVSFG